METPKAPDFKLRSGLKLTRWNESARYWLLEDSQNRKFFRLGLREAQLVAVLMKRQSMDDAIDPRLLQEPVADADAQLPETLVRWLAQCGLVESAQPSSPAPSVAATVPRLLASAFYFKLPVCDPDPWVGNLVKRCGWLFSWQFLVISTLCFTICLGWTSLRWSEFLSSYNDLFSPWRWLWMLIAWIVLKVLHEAAHAAACKLYGGEVHEAGLAMILFAPIAYVNVTSSWRFPSKWQRLHVTLAGMVIELAAATAALLVWQFSASPTAMQAAADVVLLVVASSVLFNLNPLMKFDGYYALADATGVDNLFNYGQSYASYFVNRWVLGLRLDKPDLPPHRFGWIKIYGLAAGGYRVFTVSGLLLAAAALLEGFGVVLAIGGICTFALFPLIKFIKKVATLHSEGNLHPYRMMLRVSCITAVLVGPLWLIPADLSLTVPGIVEYDPPAMIRAGTSGFVREILVTNGSVVQAGDVLMKLDNKELELKHAELSMRLAHANLAVLAAQWRGESSELLTATSERLGLEQQLAELENKFAELDVRAAADGVVISRRLPLLQGSYVEEGDELAVVGREHRKRLKLSIDQERASQSDQWLEREMRVVVPGQASLTLQHAVLRTRASRVPTEESLLCTHGGSLAVVLQPDGESLLVRPRVDAIVPLTAEQSSLLKTGQRVYAKLNNQSASMGHKLLHFLRGILTL